MKQKKDYKIHIGVEENMAYIFRVTSGGWTLKTLDKEDYAIMLEMLDEVRETLTRKISEL